MNTELILGLRRLATLPDVGVSSETDSLRLDAARCGLEISIVVPWSALEFVVEVTDGTRKIRDRLDYAGYDAVPPDQLADEMRADVLLFAERLLSRVLRIADLDDCVEWQVGDRWLPAVPFVPDADPWSGSGSRMLS